MEKKEKEIALKLCNVNKKYKLSNHEYFQALYDINAEFEKGELVSIVGESGSGKSTLMNLIGGLDSDFTGDIFAGDENLRELKDKQLDKYRKNHVGFVFQSFNLISHLSILDNVTLSLTLSNVGEKEKIERATKILERVGLSTQLKKKPTQLSGGQKQRVAIARALINDPEIIIADEPTGALDSQTSMQILEILKEIADSGKLVIMVTHSEKVASISSRVIEISDGRIIGDRINKDYKRNKGSLLANLEEENTSQDKTEETFEERSIDEQLKVLSEKENDKIEKENVKKQKRNFKNFKEKQTLSLWSAIKLSFHNMWASKTKNILMSIGVAIGIGSLILMMCFSTGITDFITDTMKSYSDPTIVTISRKNKDKSGLLGSLDYLPFDEEHPTTVDTGILADVNQYLKENNVKWNGELYQITQDNVTFGFNIITLQGAEVSYTNSNGETKTLPIYCVYSIPPYYTEKNIVEGERSQPPVLDEGNNLTSGGGFMFTQAIYELIEEPIGENVKISIMLQTGVNNEKQPPEPIYSTLTAEDKICGIMDTSVMSGYLVLYVDYDYLEHIFITKGGDKAKDIFAPTILYINTPDESITNKINTYLATRDDYKGSIEDQFAGMFNNMSSVIGTSLIVISCISLFVSAMMILVVLYMSVTERTKEIGVLKSIGARRKDIRRIFTSESFLIGLLSGVVGILFNLLLTLIVWVALTSTIGLAPISYRWWYFVVAVLVAVFISMVSGLYPANKASKLDPVESLRRE